jgi:hypothetical protein
VRESGPWGEPLIVLPRVKQSRIFGLPAVTGVSSVNVMVILNINRTSSKVSGLRIW